MIDSRSWVVNDANRSRIAQEVIKTPLGDIVSISEPTRNLLQNSHAHAALADIARQVTWHGKRFNVLTWKRLTMAAFLREQGQQPELIPALDGKGFDIIFEHTSKLGKKKFAAWLEWIYSFGAQNGVVFRDRRHAA